MPRRVIKKILATTVLAGGVLNPAVGSIPDLALGCISFSLCQSFLKKVHKRIHEIKHTNRKIYTKTILTLVFVEPWFCICYISILGCSETYKKISCPNVFRSLFYEFFVSCFLYPKSWFLQISSNLLILPPCLSDSWMLVSEPQYLYSR